jgi:hypothetical protein
MQTIHLASYTQSGHFLTMYSQGGGHHQGHRDIYPRNAKTFQVALCRPLKIPVSTSARRPPRLPLLRLSNCSRGSDGFNSQDNIPPRIQHKDYVSTSYSGAMSETHTYTEG